MEVAVDLGPTRGDDGKPIRPSAPDRSLDMQKLAHQVARLQSNCSELIDKRKRNVDMAIAMLDGFDDSVKRFMAEDPVTGQAWFMTEPSELTQSVIANANCIRTMLEIWLAEIEVACSQCRACFDDDIFN